MLSIQIAMTESIRPWLKVYDLDGNYTIIGGKYDHSGKLNDHLLKIYDLLFESNGSQLKNPDISGGIVTLSLSILIWNSQCVEGARDVRFL